MKMIHRVSKLTITFLVFVLAGCSIFNGSAGSTSTFGRISASGTITTNKIQVAPEIGGKIVEIKVDKGSMVKAGDEIFRLDDQVLQAQYKQAQQSVNASQAALDAAQKKLANAQAQYDLTAQAVRQQDQANHTSTWLAIQPDQITLPTWYFHKSEEITALQTLITQAQTDLDSEQANLDQELKAASNQDFVAAEKRLDQAQQAYIIANETLNEAKGITPINSFATTTPVPSPTPQGTTTPQNTDLADAAQKIFDSAKTELDAAQKAYDQMLSSDAAKRVSEARARVAVAQERLFNTRDTLNHLQTGDQSLQINLVQTAVDQAKSGIDQAQAALSQAQAAQDLLKVQLDKTVVSSPISGIVLSRPMNVGEVTAAGVTIIEVGQLDQVTLTVYIPENQYGQIKLDEIAKISVDSFPGKTFSGSVTYIADQAEFTPRNVQTVDSRSTTVYKVEITLPNPDGNLKPGMPADATLGE